MHLRKSDEAIRSGITMDVDTSLHMNGTSKSTLKNSTAVNGDVTAKHEVEILIEQQELDAVLDTIITSWILLVLRYQRDSFQNCTWGFEQAGGDVTQSFQADQFDLLKLETVDDLLEKVKAAKSQEISTILKDSPSFYFNDGTSEEWAFRISVEFQPQKVLVNSSWKPPTMAPYQASAQLRSFVTIFNSLLHDPRCSISSTSAIQEDELETIWHRETPLPPSLDTCMHEIISERALLHPDKNAIEAWDGSLTYAEVDEYSTVLAQNIRLIDDSAAQIIPVLFEKCRWTIVAVLAVMKAGACFALLDPAQPEGRLRAITQQTNATILIASETQSTLAARVSPGSRIVPVSKSKFVQIYHPFAAEQPNTSIPDVPPSAPLYIQFTSGSTGLPKGCIITHSQYTSGAMPRAAEVGYHSESRVLDFASYAFDVCIDSMLLTLSHGATLCTLSDEQRMNDLSGAMRRMRVTLAGMTPSVARTLDPDILPSLESIAVGGEGISASDATAWSKKTKVVNCYGPSECTVGATYNNRVGSTPYISMGSGKGCSLWITDPTNHNVLLPPGAVGELLIEGPIVGNGYLNNPAKTNEVFIKEPEFLVAGCKSIPGRRGRIYKTGDLVRYDPDGHGEVVFVGRQDQQVKLRGQRIELAEIEYNMTKHLPLEAQLAVEVIKPGGNGEATLIAFLVEQKKSGMKHLDGGIFGSFSNSFSKALQAMTKQLYVDLPSYMVPSAYIPLWKMPLLVSCKTDRKRLREIGTSITRHDLRRFAASVSQRTEPTSEIELKLAKLWAKVLGGDDDFSANDSFFSMGGDSLRAMRLVAAAREEGIVISVPDIMLNPTLSAMAPTAKLEGGESRDVPNFSLIPSDWQVEEAKAELAGLCSVTTEEVEDVYPCTPLQEGLMALSAKFLDAYVAQRVVELPLEAAKKLVGAFEKVAADSPVLRTRIVNVPGRGLFQVVLKDGELVRHHGTDLVKYLKLDREEPMDLGKALFRYGLVHDPESEKAHVAITMHHAVYDGWSMPLVLSRVNKAYNDLELAHPITFKHFIKHLTQLDTSVSKKYWHERLEGVNPHQFPPLPSKGYTTEADSLLEHYVTVPTTAHSRLTLATIIRGAWALVSSLYMNHNDVVFGETLTGRSAPVPGIEQIEGPMITTVPIRVQLDFGRPISEFLQIVHAQTIKQIPHEHLGLQNIRRLSRSARYACDLRTGLVLHPKENENCPSDEAANSSPAESFLPADDEEAAREALKFNTYALMLVCTLDENGFLIMASFDQKCISSPAVERVLKVLDRIVTAFLGNPESKLGDLAVLDPDELQDAIALRPEDAMFDSMEPLLMNGHVKQEESVNSSVLTPNEEKLKGLLSRILGIQELDINPNDSFFELGGDSISAMRLVSEARVLGAKITVAQIFKSQSLSELAASFGNEKEEKLVGLLSRILNIPKEEVSPQDSFFELGGDSIGAMRLVAEARSEGLTITVAQIFQSTSISELSSLAEENSSTSANNETNTPFIALGSEAHLFSPDRIQPLLENPEWDITDIYPVRPLQKVAVEGTVDLPRYSLRYELIQFKAAIDRPRLAQSCQDLVSRNEVLRTVFVEFEGHCLGVVLPSLQVPYEEVPVPDGLDLNSFAQGFIHRDIQTPKPYGSSFVSFTLFTSSTGASTLAFRISHAQYDEICLPIVFRQLSALYAGTTVPETLPFIKHVNHVAQHNIPQSIPYWRNLLSNAQMSVFKPEIQLSNRKAASIYQEFDIATRPSGITIGSLPTAAWAVVLARRLGVKDVVFGEVVTGRNIGVESADRVFGPTWQYIPFRVPFAKEWTYLDLLRFVQAQHTESAAYEGMGLSEIVEQCTDWDPKEVSWFDSVVHQAPREWVDTLRFGAGSEGEGVEAVFETLYPHAEPLREWKVQAFVLEGGKRLGIEIVTFEGWIEVGEEILAEIGEVLGKLVANVGERVEAGEIAKVDEKVEVGKEVEADEKAEVDEKVEVNKKVEVDEKAEVDEKVELDEKVEMIEKDEVGEVIEKDEVTVEKISQVEANSVLLNGENVDDKDGEPKDIEVPL